jgi:hypothetical protein
MTQPKPAPKKERVSEVAGRILAAFRSGHCDNLERELEYARRLTRQTGRHSTLEMERLEALTGAVESLGHGAARHAGAVRLLEHLAHPRRALNQPIKSST